MSIMDIIGAAEQGENPMAGGGLPLWPPMTQAGMEGAPGMAADMPPEEPAGGEGTIDILNRMIEDAKLYIDTEQDEEDKLTMAKVLTMLQGYLAEEQKESDQAIQGKASPKLMRRAYGG